MFVETQCNCDIAYVCGFYVCKYCTTCPFCIQASSIHVNPLYLMLPVTVAASFAFMLPVATPPNAIVFAYGQMKLLDMVKAYKQGRIV